MQNCNNINLSVIIPVYNVEKYLVNCIDSLIYQDNLDIEIILINDGSTDSSGYIADQYTKKEKYIKVIHQENRGASSARNAGLHIARGEYIAFLDSDDWVKENSLFLLYQKAVEYKVDIVMGNLCICNQDGNIEEHSKSFNKEILNKIVSGKEGFIWLVKNDLYTSTSVRYIYSRDYLHKIQARFEEGIMHEDELWLPFVLYQAEKIIITDIEFYYYRQNEESVMHTTNIFHRLQSLFKVTDILFQHSEQLHFYSEDKELKSWWLVNICRLYAMAFTLLSLVKNSSYTLPKNHLDHFWRDCWLMTPESIQRCRDYYHVAEVGLKIYTDWRMSDWVVFVDFLLKEKKKLMLIYNMISNEDLCLDIKDVPTNWVITTDRKYFQQANLVVFYIPSLYQELENDLNKEEGQIWVNWYPEFEKNNPLINAPEINDIFDLSISYQEDKKIKENPLISLCRNAYK